MTDVEMQDNKRAGNSKETGVAMNQNIRKPENNKLTED